MHQRSSKPPSGLTLIEVIIAMVLLGIVSASLISLNGGLFKHASTAEETKQASLMVQACMDHLIGIRKLSGVNGLDATALQTACRDNIPSLNTDIKLYVELFTVSVTCPTSACTAFSIQAKSNTTSWKTEPAVLFFATY